MRYNILGLQFRQVNNLQEVKLNQTLWNLETLDKLREDHGF